MSTMQVVPDGTVAEQESRPVGSRWPWWGVAAGALGLYATWFSFQQVSEDAKAEGSEAVYDALTSGQGVAIGLGARAGFAALVCLLIFGAGLVRFLQQRGAGRTLAFPVLKWSIPATAGAMVVTWSMKAMLAGGMPDGVDEAFYTHTDTTVLHLLVDQLQWTPWWGLVVGAGGLAVLALKERVLPRWIGWVSVVAVVLTALMTFSFALPYSAGVVTPPWLLVISLGLLRDARRP
jgi:hypothetical protein